MNQLYNDNNSVFVNPRQYEAIQRRRAKKLKQQKAHIGNIVKIKQKFKYKTRSNHAKNRKRASDGKFVSNPQRQDSKTASSAHEPEANEEERPCCADEEEENRDASLSRKGKPHAKESKPFKTKLKKEEGMVEDDRASMNSEELFGKLNISKQNSTRPGQMATDVGRGETLSLRRNDSLYDHK
jgi:hypothetical protein